MSPFLAPFALLFALLLQLCQKLFTPAPKPETDRVLKLNPHYLSTFLDQWHKELPRSGLSQSDHNTQYKLMNDFLATCEQRKVILQPHEVLERIHENSHRLPGYDPYRNDKNLLAFLELPKILQREAEEKERERLETRRLVTLARERREQTFETLFRKQLDDLDKRVKESLPPKTDGVCLGTAALILTARNPKKLIADITYRITTEQLDRTHFHPSELTPHNELRKTVYEGAPTIFRNLALASENKSDEYLDILKSKRDPVTLVKDVFKYTPFVDILMQPFELRIPDTKRFEHWHILAKTGHGKTQTLHNIILQDIMRPDPPSLIIIDPKGDIVEPVSRLKLFAQNPERLSIIDPVQKPALNFFDLPDRIRKYPPDTRSLVIGKIAEAYSQALASADAEITPPQRNALNNVVRLVFSIGGNLRDLLDILDDDPPKSKDASAYEMSRFRPHIEKLDEWAVRFFKTQFYEGQFRLSRRSLSSKLQNIVSSFLPFGDIFGASRNTLDLYQAMETPGSIVLINTNKGILGEYASALFGRLMVAQVMTAALQRGFLKSNRNPVFLIVDEAQDYFDESFQTILEQTRSANVGLIFAHHLLSQVSRFHSTALSMPTIRMAAPELPDLDTISAAMNIAAELIKDMPKGHFALSVRGQPTVTLSVPFGSLKQQPQSTPDEYKHLLAGNARRFSASPQPSAPDRPQQRPTTTQPRQPAKPASGKIELPDDDI